MYLWSLYQKEVNSVNKPLVTITIDDLPVIILVDTGSSVNLQDEKTFQSLKQCPALTKEHNPVIPYAGNQMNILGKFDAEIEGNQRAVRNTAFVTGEGKAMRQPCNLGISQKSAK